MFIKQQKTNLQKSLLKGFLCLLLSMLAISSLAATTEQLSSQALLEIKQTIQAAGSFDDKFAAEVWLVGMRHRLKKFVPESAKRLALLRMIHENATRAQLSPQLVLSVIEVESRFNTYAISSAGAQGLMQVMPFWKKSIGEPHDNLTNAETNLRYGCNILSHYLKIEKGNMTKALARYNGSKGQTWYPERVLLAWERHWFVN